MPGIGVLDLEQVDVLPEELARLAPRDHSRRDLFHEFPGNESADPTRTLFHALGAWRIESGFRDLPGAPELRMAAYQFLGGRARQLHDHLCCKRVENGGVVAWHRDYSYWTWTCPVGHLTCWIAFDDVTMENGSLYQVPGSRRYGLLPITGLKGDMHAVGEVLDDEQREAFVSSVLIELERGCALFQHSLMRHGSHENGSLRLRRAVVLNVVKDAVRSDPGACQGGDSEGLPVPSRDEPLAGQFHPALFAAEKEPAEEVSTVVTIEDLREGAGDAPSRS